MENNNKITEDANSKSLFPANETDRELYSIPANSGWFSWDAIHEIERNSLKDFFDGSSVSRTPKIYKEYRDFIICKYREDPSRRLSFTEVRKSLIGDVTFLYGVFVFLENWGLINFGVSSASRRSSSSSSLLFFDGEDERGGKVRFEERPPNGVRVVSGPYSSKVVSSSDVGDAVESAFKLPPLASYSDVFGDLMRFRGSVCGNCGEECSSVSEKVFSIIVYDDSGIRRICRFKQEIVLTVSPRDESANTDQESTVMCLKCCKIGSSGETNGGDDYKFKDSKDRSDNQGADFWSEAETLLLLESVSRHGDDWDLVAQNVQTKNKFDCIARLIQLPFGEPLLAELMANSIKESVNDRHSISGTDNNEQVQCTPVESPKILKKETENGDLMGEMEQVDDEHSENPPLKRRCVASVKEAGGSLMKQKELNLRVAHSLLSAAILATAVSPNIAAAAAEAALTALRDDIQFGMEEVFMGEMHNDTALLECYSSNDEPGRDANVVEFETGEQNALSETSEDKPAKPSVSLAFQIRAAAATALGAAAAHAKILADQEEREIEHLVATVIETQLRKLHSKIKHFEELGLIMEREYSLIQEIKESVVTERINTLQHFMKAGISRWKDNTAVRSFTSSVS
ncbi:hypothetical protein Syun_024549 [Stephania yunnanensis]|uniref:SWI/SNF complex subunit SWI3A n=1 Tax=Stephania yunnanensis TaxID=152371 RepID=A0AAP0I4L8_9MAGN